MLRTIRSRLLMAGLLILALSLALVEWSIQRTMARAMQDGLLEQASDFAPLLAASLTPLVAAGDPAALQDALAQAVGPRPGLAGVEILDARGRPLAAAGDNGPPATLSIPLVQGGTTWGEARLRLSDAPWAGTMARLRRDELLIGALVGGTGFALLALVVWLLGRPTAALVRAGRRIAQGQFDLHVAEVGGLEVRLLARALNHVTSAVRAQMDRVGESERHLRSVVAALSEGLIVQDRGGRVTDANEAAARIMGLPLGELLQASTGRPRARLARAGEDWLALDQRPAWRALETGQPQFEPLLRVERADGGEGWVQIRSEPVPGPDGRPAFVVSTLTDLSRHVDAESALRDANLSLEHRVAERTQELRVAKEAAEQASRAKSEFLSRMSHELRTPLNAILGFAQLMSLESGRADADQERLRQILSAGWHLLALIDDVLDLSRIEAGKMAVSLEPVDLAPLATRALEMTQRLAEQHGVSLQLPTGQAEPWVRADRRRLLQVLANLLSNAVKYNRLGGRATLAWQVVGEQVRIEVRDEGQGLTADQIGRLFVPFTRFDRSGREGTGIGLVITRHMVQLMGGELSVASTPGAGSCFAVTLSRVEAPAEVEALAVGEPPPAPAPPETPAAPPAGRCRHVHYVEDNPSNRRLMEQLLATRPHLRLETSTDGREALDRLRAAPPDLAILDIDLPGLDGISLCRQLRADPELARLPLIALTAQAMPAQLRQMQAAGFDAIITKPLNLAQMMAQLDRLLPGIPD